MTFSSINPATEETFATYQEISIPEAKDKIRQADRAYSQWKEFLVEERCKIIKTLALTLRKNTADVAILIAQEMGKPVKEARAELLKCASTVEFYAKNAPRFLKNKKVETDADLSYISFAPLGVILGIMPWNFPFWQVFRFAIPSLLAGNTVAIKHAENVPKCAITIEEIFNQALPSGLYTNLLVHKSNMEKIIEDPLIRGISLTGSVRAGAQVAKIAAPLLKKLVLELGGSDAYLILEDADLDHAAKTCVTSRLINAGQSCIAAKRFIAVRSVFDQFEQRVVSLMESKKMGDPLDENNDIGPLARKDLRDNHHHQVQESIRQGADCLLGGQIPNQKGYFYPPTVLSHVEQGMVAFEEELFGPTAVLISAKDEADAIALANASSFGLGACVFTKDKSRGQYIAEHELEAGSCFVNTFVHSDPRLPFGGIKQSGHGRELSEVGIKEFVNIKTVFLT